MVKKAPLNNLYLNGPFRKPNPDTTIELDVVDVSSVNIVLEETFGEEVFPEEINNNDGSRMEDLVGDSSLDTISELWFGKEARPEEVCCVPSQVDLSHFL